MKKFLSLALCFVLIFFSVAFADEEQNLEQGEASIKQISRQQTEENSQVSQRLAELKRREKELAEREAKYKAEQEAAELAALEAEMARREAEMSAKEAEAEKRRADQRSAELVEKEQEIARREVALQQKEDALRAMEEKVIDPKNFTADAKTTVSDASAYAVITQTENGLMNWTEDYIQATGMAVAPPRAKGAQGKALARRGATLDLQRNLLETLKGVQVDAETRMEDFMAEDTVMSRVSGIIKGVEVINGEWDGEAYTVTGRIKMPPIRSSIAEKIPAANKKAPKGSREPKAQKSAGRFTGLVIDVRHLPLIPSMSFRVLDESGREVYSMSFVDHDRYMQSGLCAYYNNINFAKGEVSIAGNPIVTKAVRLSNGDVDIVIPNSQAAKVRGSSYDFRRDCKIIIVKS